MILIPASAVEVLRDGLRNQIGTSAEHLMDAETQVCSREHPDRYQKPLRSLNALQTLLDTIGWNTPPKDHHIDPQVHGWALVRAITDAAADLIDMLHEIDNNDATRIQEGKQPQRATLLHNSKELCSLGLITLQALRPPPNPHRTN
jgi:hypothetical protein